MAVDWIKKLPTTSMSFLLENLLLHINLPVGDEVIEAGYWELNKSLIKKIREANGQILHAKTKDDAVIAKTKVDLFKEEQQKIADLSRSTAVKDLLKGEYFTTGYLNGDIAVIPSRAWSGKIDWEEERIIFSGKEYSNLRVISQGRLTKEQVKLIKQYADGDIDAQCASDKTPGRPSNMHLVEQKLRQRAKDEELKISMNEEAAFLEKWFRGNHLDKKPMTAKAISNKYRSLFRELKEKSA